MTMDTQTILSKVLVWQFGGQSGNLRSQNQYSPTNGGNGYNLLCTTNNQFLTYIDGSQPPGSIDLDFTTNANLHKAHFRLLDGAEREIVTGEKVAFGMGGLPNAYLYYAERPISINLKFGSTVRDEWYIYDETGEKGRPIAMNARVALLNVNVEPDPDFLVYLDRPGADIGWTSSPDWKKKVTNWVAEQAFKAAVTALTA